MLLVKQLVGIGVTSARYGLAERMARRVADEQSIDLDMAAFIGADILDGAILREFDADTRTRRVADGLVDHISEVRVATEVAKKYPETRGYIGILAVRAAFVGGLNLFHLIKTGEATKGGVYQRTANLVAAGFALVATRGNERATRVAGAVAAGVAIGTGIMRLKGLGKRHDGITRNL